METKEFNFKGFTLNGFLMLFLLLVILGGNVWLYFLGDAGIVAGIVVSVLWFIFLFGFVKLEPNEAMVMIFFGKYRGVLRETGFFWVNPFMSKKKLSMRARNLNVNPIKVNDKVGNPILIGLVLVWKLKDTYKAMFEIDAQTMAASKPGKDGTVTYSVSKQMDAFENFV
ncbi:MAG: SPFH domain-containing protein, partial [Bacteroidia bacterium]|nr:SPFH domain-containing protein [Bacteroidia bacterium]